MDNTIQSPCQDMLKEQSEVNFIYVLKLERSNSQQSSDEGCNTNANIVKAIN